MKIIFLDIDGVLNNTHTENPRKFPYIVDPELVERLKALLTATGAQIVLSSTWRYDPVGLLAAEHHGIPFIDATPDLPEKARRDEIRQWISDHGGVERFLVIDDEDDELDELPLFQPFNKIGLDQEIVAGAAAYLNGQTDNDMRRSVLVRVAENVSAAFRGHKG
jgi:HAD domain in Swiss Army Knife RNA repair proteins